VDALEALEAYLPLAIRHIYRQPALTLMNLKSQQLVNQPLRQSVANWFMNSFAGMPNPFEGTGMKPGLVTKGAQGIADAVDGTLAWMSKKFQGLKVDWSPGAQPGSVKWSVIDKGGNRIMWADTQQEAQEMLQQLSSFRAGAASRASAILTSNIYRGTIALNIGSAVRNMQQVLNTAVNQGVWPTMKGLATLLNPADKDARALVSQLIGAGHVREKLLDTQARHLFKEGLEKYDQVLFAPFNAAEYFTVENRDQLGVLLLHAVVP